MITFDILQLTHPLHVVVHDKVAVAPHSETEKGTGRLRGESRVHMGEEETTAAEETLDIDRRSCRKYIIQLNNDRKQKDLPGILK